MKKEIQVISEQSSGRTTKIQKYLDDAVDVLKQFGLTIREEESPLVGILSGLSNLSEAKVLAVSKVLGYESSFNQLVRDNVQEMNVGTRYEDVISAFDSVVTDARALVGQLDDGKIDATEKMQNLWMRLSRGTTHKRFERIGRVHKNVSASTKEQLDKEVAIRDAYVSFRSAYQIARTIVLELFELQKERLKAAELEASRTTTSVDDYIKLKTPNPVELAKLQTARDEKVLSARIEDRNYQTLKDFSEGMSNGYSVGEVLIAKLMQIHGAKEQVYRRSSIFFATNEHVFTTLDAVLTSQLGLHEATQELEAEKRVVNKGLEAVAGLSNRLEKAAIQAGYGSTTNPESVKRLVDSVVNYQIESRTLIRQLRDESTKQAQEIEVIVEEGKRKVQETTTKYLK
jgi:hypothetical protein